MVRLIRYYPVSIEIIDNGKNLQTNAVTYDKRDYNESDFSDFARAVTKYDTKCLLIRQNIDRQRSYRYLEQNSP